MWHLQDKRLASGRHPVTRVLLLILLALAIIAAVIFGAIILLFLLLTAAAFFVFLYLRARWLRHRLGLNLHPPHHRHTHRGGTTIEGEYTVEPDDRDHNS